MGIAYWYAVLPLHGIVFKGMLRGLIHAAVVAATQAPSKAGEPSRS